MTVCYSIDDPARLPNVRSGTAKASILEAFEHLYVNTGQGVTINMIQAYVATNNDPARVPPRAHIIDAMSGWVRIGWLRKDGGHTRTQSAPEDVEGLEDGQPSSWKDYPIDSLLIRQENRTVHDVLRRIDAGRFVMNPDFQRDFIWKEEKQIKLIESVIMRIPLPVLYLAEDEQGRMIVVDGLQRLSTFKRFVDNKLKLDIPHRDDLHKKEFRDLPPKLQNRVEDCNLILYVIDQRVPEQARLDIFDRVNSGEPLSRQQMRNSLYSGAATNFLKEESATKIFRGATGNSLKKTTMRDREFVNRFCAFQVLKIDEYRDMDDFLAKGLKKMNAAPDRLPELSSRFRRSLANNFRLFGRNAFRKHQPDQEQRGVLNASLWDVMSTGLSGYEMRVVEEKSDALRAGFFRLLDDDDFKVSITYGPNDPKKVKHRFSAAGAMIAEAFGAGSP